MTAPLLKVVEWVPGKWWVVEDTGRGYVPLYRGRGRFRRARRKDCEAWLAREVLAESHNEEDA